MAESKDRAHEKALDTRDWLAREIREKSEPNVARTLTKGKSDKVDSATADKIASDVARNANKE